MHSAKFDTVKKTFLKAYGKTGMVTTSAEAAGIDRTTHYVWLREDTDYTEAIAKEKSV